ncbi:glycosyltransferase family 4 protein [Aquibacillus koreensis]|uniref:Glycosyltransferase family 4 protein n=1 Tax=Aquibacillus koreensis TaxID=279446 RepID=A0A9X4AI80_9BACI|nr:glycosyltransferase family 4 protein [Aquibacillus koreensis]MCT2536003.1 glycosyltransferase family 4 protein [Aquibacillus koreensis]MDC3420459.1 glycosyltransferase family 4 protein [Aquibacillus koreensis]
MKIVLATPNFHQPRGNTITVQRMADGLEKIGVHTQIISITEDNDITTLPESDLVHGFHAYRFYTFMQELTVKPKDYIVTITGTDLNHNLYDKDTRKDVIACLQGARAIHVFHEEAKQMISTEVPEVTDKLQVLAQGASTFPPMGIIQQKEPGTFLFALPAGVRRIKNIPFAIDTLRTLYEQDSSIRLWLIGPILEDAEGNDVKALVEENKEWVTYIGKVPHEEMGAVYHQADCILNTSFSEGQSSAILEAMANEVPVLVANNEGNASIVQHEKTGFLYEDASKFLDYAKQIINDISLREELVANAKHYIEENHSSEHEATFLLQLYESVLTSN